MAKEDKRYIVLPKTPKGLQGLEALVWFAWYIDNEPRLSENHSRARVAQRLLAAFEDLKPPTDELDAIKEATAKRDRLKAELDDAEKWLEALLSGPPPKPIPAYPGDVAEVLDDDWKLVHGWLTDEKDPPKCGFAPQTVVQMVDGSLVKQQIPTRRVLDYIDAIRGATTKKPEPPAALPSAAESETLTPLQEDKAAE